VIPFEQYVKGVLPHEWIPSWDPKALEMGAVAIRTYAAWWVVSGGKYDCADLDDTTASQVYKDETLPKTDAAVDATAGAYIVKDGSLVFAEYSAENGSPTKFGVSEPHCAGKAVYGHGRGTCQWGTQRWAINEGKDFVWMSAHYYPGAAVELPGPRFAAEQTAESYPATMTAGDEAVVWLEYRNTGAVTWSIQDTRVGTSEPRDRPSPFYKEGNWLSPSRPTAADHSDYGPGAVGRFSFVIKAPEVDTPTTFVEHFALVQEGETWFGPEDSHVTWTITVNPRSGATPDPNPDVPGDQVGEEENPAASEGGCTVSAGRPPRRGWATGLSRDAVFVVLAITALRRGRRFALVAALAALPLALVAGCAQSPPAPEVVVRAGAPLGGDSALVPVIRDAAREFGVPEEIVATVAFSKTRLRMQLDRELDHTAPEYGMMALGEGGVADVGAAAARLGVPADVVKTDVRENLRAGASALAREAERQGLRPVTLVDWAPVLGAYLGGAGFEDEIMWRLERGWRGKDDQGKWVILSARALGGVYEGATRTSRQQGYGGAIWNPANSGNYQAASRGAGQINYVVIHTTQGSYAGTISWFKNSASNVSAHYVVRSSDGQITQMVDDSDIAWHDACFNSETIGIEHEGFVDDPDAWYTEAMYTKSAALTAWLCDQYGIPKDHAHIMGHGEAPDCSDHTDPGGGWNWAHYLQLVQTGGTPHFDADEGAHDFPAEMVSGEEGVAWFEFGNLSNVTWGLDETRLGTTEPDDRESPFYVEGNWLGKNRPTGADHSNYGPGSTGRFTFAIKAPEVSEETVFVEKFRLVQEGVTWFGPTVTMTIRVKPRAGTPEPPDVKEPTPPVAGTGDEEDPGAPDLAGCSVTPARRAADGGGLGLALLLGCAILARVATRRRR
jgi:N-acetyl-anhydromuramyl-L-alanine amidase AmpD